MSLKHKTVVGALWTIAAGVGGRAIGLVGTLALTRFVAPREYGAVSVVAIVVATVNAVTMFGFGHYIVVSPKEGDRTVFHATLYHLALGAVAFCGLWVARHTLGRWLDTPELAALMPGVLIAIALDRVAYVPTRVLARDMCFRVLALRNVASEVAYVAVAVALAARGWGATAIVWGIVARALAGVLVAVGAIHPRRWLDVGRLSLETTRKMLRYSLPLAVANPLQWLSQRGDNLLIAGLFGPTVAGKYNLAYNLADIPATHIGEHIGDVLMPSFAKMKQRADRARAAIRASGLLAILVFPLALGLGAIAPTLVRAVFDQRWWDIGPMLVLLSVLSVLRPLGWMLTSYLQAVKHTRLVLVLEAAKTLAMVTLVVILGQTGVLWACSAIGLAFALHTAGTCAAVRRAEGVSVRGILASVLPPLFACVPMVLAVLATSAGAELMGLSPWLSLACQVVAGALFYVVAAWLVAPRQSRDLVGLLAEAVGRRGLRPSAPSVEVV